MEVGVRLALGIAYRGQAYNGWQSQPCRNTIQDKLDEALSQFAGKSVHSLSAGRTDARVHGLNQVVHIDAPVRRSTVSWVRGTNRFLPPDIAVHWCCEVGREFHARYSAHGRRYTYVLLESVIRPSVDVGMVGWVFRPLDGAAMRAAASLILGEHDFSAFRSSECQAPSPIKMLRSIEIRRCGSYWRFDFDGNAFLHHMVRNIMGCFLAIGNGSRAPSWIVDVLESRVRANAAPTFSPAGLYFVGPYYDAKWAIPSHTSAMDWLPN